MSLIICTHIETYINSPNQFRFKFVKLTCKLDTDGMGGKFKDLFRAIYIKDYNKLL